MAELRDQVVFNNVSKSYPTGAHVECSYTMKSSHVPSTYDWIGLFKVGWASDREFIFYQWVPFPKDKEDDQEVTGSLLFQSVHLPKEDGEYYQFVYFNDKAKMCGASAPFYFLNPCNEDIVEENMQEDADMLYITTRKGLLDEKKKECLKLTKTVEAMDQEMLNLTDQLKLTEKRLDEVEAEKALLIEKLVVSEELSKKLADSEEKVSQRDNLNKQMQVEIDRLNAELEQLKNEQQVLLEQLTSTENAKDEEMAELKRQLAEVVADKEAFDTLQAKLSASRDKITNLESKKNQQKELINEQHDKLQALEARHLVDTGEITSLRETLTNLSMKIEEVNNDNEGLKTLLTKVEAKHEQEKKDWAESLEVAEKEKNSLLSTIGELNHKLEKVKTDTVSAQKFDIQEDRYIALQAAYGILKEELREQQSSVSAAQRREQRVRATCNAQVEEVKDKLKEAKDEYTQLARRNAKLEKRQSKASTRTGSSDASPLKRSMSAANEELTKEELQKMVEQLSAELEARTQKKDRYKDKYLEEKQRAAVLRDHYKSEVERLKRDLQASRMQLEGKFNLPAVEPIVYPEVPAPGAIGDAVCVQIEEDVCEQTRYEEGDLSVYHHSVKTVYHGKLACRALGRKVENMFSLCEKGATAQKTPVLKIVKTDMWKGNKSSAGASGGKTPPTSPTKPLGAEAKVSNKPQATSNPDHAEETHPSAIIYKNLKRQTEALVMPQHSDSEDDNEAGERFHDASEEVVGPKCPFCEKIFVSSDTEEMRNKHVSDHMDANCTVIDESSVDDYLCPICKSKFSKSRISFNEMQAHVDAHFATSQQNY